WRAKPRHRRSGPIPTHDEASLVHYFQEKKPPLQQTTPEMRARAAAWKWLQPHPPSPTLAELSSIRVQLSFDAMPPGAFMPLVRQECVEILRDHPRLSFWIHKRVALLDFLIDPPSPIDRDLRERACELRKRLLFVTHALYSDRERSSKEARDIKQ